MTMHVNLSKEMEAFIKGKVATGFYGNATEVIRDAIRRMQEDETRIAAFQAAVDEGEAELERGEGLRWTENTMNEIVQEALSELDPSVQRARG